MNRILDTLLEILITSGIIWGAIMAFKRLFRTSLSPKVHTAVWLILLARLLFPFTLDTGVHFIYLPVASSETEQTVTAETENIFPAGPAAVSSAPAPRHGEPVRVAETEEGIPSVSRQNAVTSTPAAEPEAVLLAVWILGILIFAAFSLRGYEKLKHDVRQRMVQDADPLHLLFQQCMGELGIRRRVFLAVQNELAGPALMFPNIVLISDTMLSQEPEKTRMALLHELTHFVRRDHLKAAALCMLRMIWWFNPFVWLAVREIREDLETACDSEVVARLGKNGRKAYAQTVLSMFGRTETNPAVLGMAFGGARKNAEKRIRGIYMKTTSRLRGKAAVLLLAGVLGVACFTTACQPTPAQEAVVNQKEGIPEDALVGQSESADPQATTAPAAEYSVAEHWSETVDKAANFKVTADVDILTPDVEAYPVEKLAPREMTQELADQLIDYFIPNGTFYHRGREQTKADLEEEILNIQEVLANDRARGDEEAVAEDEEILAELQEQYAAAPETAQQEPATTEFTYEKDYTGAVLEEYGPIFIDIDTHEADGTTQQISVRKQSPTDVMMQPYFMYNSGITYITEAEDRNNQEKLEEDMRSVQALDEPMRSEEMELIETRQAQIEHNLPLYAQNSMSAAEARQKGEDLLETLDIRGAQFFTCEKALLGPETGETDAGVKGGAEAAALSQPGMYLTFQRENGGIPCVAKMMQNGLPNPDEKEYSAPFLPESGAILFDEDWNVRLFVWENPTRVLEIVAPDSHLIPLDEAKDRLIEELYRDELSVSSEYIEEFGLRYDVTEMKLVMGYVDVQGEEDNALAIPAWFMVADGYELESENEPIRYNRQEVMISALDGAPILLPGSAQSYHSGPEEAE